jgi:cell division protein FtsL
VGVLLFSVLMLFTMEHFQSLEARYQIESLKTQSAQLEESNARLRRDQADLTKPQRLEKLAIQYGMVRASAQQVITWGQGEAVPLPEP